MRWPPQAVRGPEPGGAPRGDRRCTVGVGCRCARVRRVKVECDLRVIHAPTPGTILEVFRHAGDSVSTDQPSPILRMADTSLLRIRLEVDEVWVTRVMPGQEGMFQIRGAQPDAGRLAVTTVIPAFGPKRLFSPDTSAQVNTGFLSVFCEPTDRRVPLYPGQHVTATLTAGPAAVAASAEGPRPGAPGHTIARR